MSNDKKYILFDKSDLIELIQSIHDNVKNKYPDKTIVTEIMPGLMSSDDKAKLDGIEEGANRYTHPNNSGFKHIPTGGSANQILRYIADGTAKWDDDTYNILVLTKTEIQSMVDKAFN